MNRNLARLRWPLKRTSGLVLSLYSLLSLALTYPLIANLDRAVPNDIGDPLLNTWILAWDTQALLTDPLRLFQANIYYPLPQTLAYSEHLFSTALLALPVQLISGEPLVAYNLSLLLTFPLAAFGMYLLVWRWTGQQSVAFIAGLIFGFAPYRFAAIAHLQLLTFQWLPFILLFLDRIWAGFRLSGSYREAGYPQPPSTRHYLAFGTFLLLQILASWYLGLYIGVILLLYFVFWVLGLVIHNSQFTIHNSQFTIRPLILTLFFVALLTLPFAWPYLDLIDELRQARPLSLALSLAAAPTDLAAAAPFNTFFGPLTASFRSRAGFTEENTLFLGAVTLLLAFVALAQGVTWSLSYLPHRRSSSLTHYAIVRSLPVGRNTKYPLFLLFFLLSILLFSLLLIFPAPYAALTRLLPVTTVIRVPSRWIIPALFALAGLAALGFGVIQERLAGRWGARLKLFLLALCSGLLLAESWSVPIPLALVENRSMLNPAYAWLAGQPRPLALVELPLHSAPAPEFPEVKRLYASTLGWWSLVNGYSGYTPPRQPGLAEALAAFPGPQAITALQTLVGEPASHPPLYLLVHPGEAPLDRSRWEAQGRWQAERNPALLPLGQFEGDYLYQVLPAAKDRFPESPLATFELGEQKIQLLAAVLVLKGKPKGFLEPLGPLAEMAPALLLYWQASTPLPNDYTVFIHLRAADGFVRSQADGPPVSGRYPTSQWQPGEIVQDIHPLPPGEDYEQVDHLVIGLYDPATGERIAAFGAEGEQLGDDAVVVPIHQ